LSCPMVPMVGVSTSRIHSGGADWMFSRCGSSQKGRNLARHGSRVGARGRRRRRGGGRCRGKGRKPGWWMG